jgi:hypothetical protein
MKIAILVLCRSVAEDSVVLPESSVSSTIGGTNKTYPNDIAEILLKIALNTIKQTNKHTIPSIELLV